MGFSKEQITSLDAKLDMSHVKQRQGFDYIEGWWAINEANRIFGFDGWSRELVDLIENTPPTTNKNGNHVVSFRAKVRVTVNGVAREGVGFGNGISKDIHDAYESATKEAETDAMKRALTTFGYQFGLALYDKKKENVCDDIAAEAVKKQKIKSKEKARMTKNEGARKLFARIQSEISGCTTMDELAGYYKSMWPEIQKLPADWEREIVQQKDVRKVELDVQDIFPGDQIENERQQSVLEAG